MKIVTIEENDVIQVDATVIAGILVLLTLSSVASTSSEFWNRFMLFIITVLTALALLPFASSIVKIIEGNQERGKYLVKLGMIYLMIVVIVIIIARGFSLYT